MNSTHRSYCAHSKFSKRINLSELSLLSGFLLELLISFCWTGPDFDSSGGRAGGVEGRCVGVERRARVGDVVGEDA